MLCMWLVVNNCGRAGTLVIWYTQLDTPDFDFCLIAEISLVTAETAEAQKY